MVQDLINAEGKALDIITGLQRLGIELPASVSGAKVTVPAPTDVQAQPEDNEVASTSASPTATTEPTVTSSSTSATGTEIPEDLLKVIEDALR
jgi:hypothetical protein